MLPNLISLLFDLIHDSFKLFIFLNYYLIIAYI